MADRACVSDLAVPTVDGRRAHAQQRLALTDHELRARCRRGAGERDEPHRDRHPGCRRSAPTATSSSPRTGSPRRTTSCRCNAQQRVHRCAVPPQTIEALMTDLARLTPAMRGHIKVVSTPPGVLVTIDVTVGVTPAEHEVTAGPHDVALSRDGNPGEAPRRRRARIDREPHGSSPRRSPSPPRSQARTTRAPSPSRSSWSAWPPSAAASRCTSTVARPATTSSTETSGHRGSVWRSGGALALLGDPRHGGGESRSTPTVAIASGGVVAGWSRLLR